ncbi:MULTISPECIES: peptide ABC transporter substrate-binding protein [Rhizobium/Agrobacterium group]|jgi:peptide/nickel transport system substrate-binding protein|uniref:Peptide ABC transporter substrate-binding protein n=2 Tax=Rhizobium/Agrobacterium group TaxID=227290 RepID=A0AAJ4N6L5_AGRTU|nr:MULTISPECIES: peptide ABC transporter substrate-binding protein [Rhizobium/Agrobacterium group]KAA3502234.1 peptide ABC transporter substrate-binding protein [Agrobacterium tumefaciens]MDH7807171.1 peptide/nickel transport system substrate-binding protein [Rhizobium sp. AN67]MDP9758954.1 peptide/nickel transport system substrate-binding protein [Agrobacterium tumefaciens]MDQ1220201.1 peptide/nickel transport system substrate-binding protein [Agrobacterium sp. SORGH_AS_0745]MDQ4406264.1 pept
MSDQNKPLINTTRRQALGLLALGASGVVLSGLPGFSRAMAQDKAAKGQLTVGFSQEPTVFNPHMPHIEVDEGIHFSIFDPLFYVDEKGAFVAALAAEVPTVENGGISADGLNWKVKLRDDVKWHDGKPFTAEDVKFTLELLVDPNFRSWRKTGHEFVRDLTVVSPTEITWKMEKPFAPYPSILASTFITPKHLLGAEADRNTAAYNNAPVGTGAFKWKERVAGDYILLDANTDYFGDGPHIERLVYKYVPDLNVMYTQFKTGDIDVVGLQWITPDHYDEAKDLAGKVVNVVPGSTIESLSFNMERPQFKEPAVREALYAAIDKQSIIEALYYGLPTPTESYVPQQSFYYNPDLPKHEYSIEKAKKLLDDAGWAPGADGIRAKDGVKLAFTCSTTAGNHIREQVQQYMQQSFKDIGVEMTISNLPPAVMWGDYWMLSKFDSVIVGLDFLTGPDPDTSDFFRSTSSAAKGGSGQNTWQFVNKDVDDLLAKGGSLFVPEERKAVYLKIQEIMRKELPLLPLFQYATVRGHKQGVENVKPNVNNRIDTWNVATWRLA